MKKNSLAELFLQLVTLPSPSGNELVVGKYIKNYLDKLGVDAKFDTTGALNQSNAGNLLAKVKGKKDAPWMLFVTHMDTVETGEQPIRPIIDEEGTIHSDGNTILGADNKASIACLLETIQEVLTWKDHPNLLCVFSTREEKGNMGIQYLEVTEPVDFAFTLDGQGPLGTFVHQALGYVAFTITLSGKEAHAAIEPEKGIHAIQSAGIFLSKLQLGRDAEGNTLNIGKIVGGTGRNVVPGTVVMEGEIRGFTNEAIGTQIQVVKNVLEAVCLETKCSYTFVQENGGVPPMKVGKDNPIVSLAKRSTLQCGLPYALKSGFFTCEANFLAAKGYPVLNVCRGGKMAHSKDESITVKELGQYKKLILSLIKSTL